MEKAVLLGHGVLSWRGFTCYPTKTVKLVFLIASSKALFRKAVALRHLNRLSEARVTLQEAQVVEPHNKDIIRELEAVVQALEINHNGKRVIVDTFDNTEVQVGKKCVSSFQARDTGLGMNIDSAPVCSPVVPIDFIDYESTSVPGKTLNDEAECLSSSSTTSKSSHFTFVNKKRPHPTLKISSQDYENLLHGNNLGFYHPRSMSFMRVRTLTSKTIQTGTPHEESSGTAEVPTSSLTPESFVQEETKLVPKLVPEEVVFQVEKKTRLTTTSFSVSRVSLVQFDFTTVREHKEHLHSSRGRRPSQGRAKMGRPTACSKQRSSVAARVSISRSRYTRSIDTITGIKRKEVQSFVFDAHYHRPFKKYRIVSSTSFIASSGFQVSSSFGVSRPPLFVP
ncbi:uncharacterized protein LOC141629860 [Silene latifolia]|uniref:uncharacterized protein LOC141629860 n=1 Tax=Silene latifolia TaxID=37657 RepID=UPI003D78515D